MHTHKELFVGPFLEKRAACLSVVQFLLYHSPVLGFEVQGRCLAFMLWNIGQPHDDVVVLILELNLDFGDHALSEDVLWRLVEIVLCCQESRELGVVEVLVKGSDHLDVVGHVVCLILEVIGAVTTLVRPQEIEADDHVEDIVAMIVVMGRSVEEREAKAFAGVEQGFEDGVSPALYGPVQGVAARIVSSGPKGGVLLLEQEVEAGRVALGDGAGERTVGGEILARRSEGVGGAHVIDEEGHETVALVAVSDKG